MQSLLEKSQVDVYSPLQTALDFRTTVVSLEPSSSLAASIPQRKQLFLDEVAVVHILCKAPIADQTVFKSFLDRLEISLETFVIGASKDASARSDSSLPATTRELIDSRAIENDNPEIATDESQASVFALWKTEIHIPRSRIRTSSPSLYFSVGLRLRQSDGETEDSEDQELMPSGVAASINLLDAFKNDPQFHGKPPVLTLARLSKMKPTSGTSVEPLQYLRNPTRRLLRLVPAINTRIQFSRLGVSPTQAKVLAALDVETSSFLDGTIEINELSMSLADGHAEPIGAPESIKLPITCRPTDIRSYAYNLIPHHTNASVDRDRHVHGVTFRLFATAFQEHGTNDHKGSLSLPIRVQWRTPVDLSSLVPRRLGLAYEDSPSEDAMQPAPPTNLITMTVSGPDSVPVHGILRWNILLANRSMTRTLRLALIPVTASTTLTAAGLGTATEAAVDATRQLKSRTRQPTKKHRHKPTLSASFFSSVASLSQDGGGDRTPSEPTRAEPDLETSSSAQVINEPGLIPMTPDVRVGPLLPGESTEAQMQFFVLRPGILKIDAIRIVDLDEVEGQSKREFLDVGPDMLPDIVAVITPNQE